MFAIDFIGEKAKKASLYLDFDSLEKLEIESKVWIQGVW